jgi:uncharacterized protein (DUF1015 family)
VAEIQPFRGLRYRPDIDLRRVLAPPYDVITPAHRRELLARDERNVVRVILSQAGGGEAGYAAAGGTFERWRSEGILQEDATPALYLLEQSFPAAGRTLRRFGLVARFRAEDPERRVILPHEHTRAAPKEDRWRMLLATKANFSPVFLMFPDPGSLFTATLAEAISARPVAEYAGDGDVSHRLWATDEPGLLSRLQELMAGTTCTIADGHHRYATALRYRDVNGPDGAWTLGYFTPIGAPGLLVLPYHRILSEGPSLEEARSRLASVFRITAVAEASVAAAAVTASLAPYAFALAAPGRGALVVEAEREAEAMLPAATPPSLRALDTFFLHHVVLGPLLGVPDSAVSYVHSQGEAEEALAKGACRLAVLMRATPVEQIVAVAEAGESMPAKSTFFHPKLPSGLVIHPLAV